MIKINDLKAFKEHIKFLRDSSIEIPINLNEKGLNTRFLDPANVMFIQLELFSSSFIEYNNFNKNFVINVNDLYKNIKDIKKDSSLSLDYTDKHLIIKEMGLYENITQIPFIDSDIKEQKDIPLEHKGIIEISANILNDIIKQFDLIGDSLKFELFNNKLILSCDSGINNKTITLTTNNDIKIINKNSDGSAIISKYSIEYLKKIVNTYRLTDKYTLKLSTDYPIEFNFNKQDEYSYKIILAPMVSD